MGDPKRPKKKYSGPSHPWTKSRIEEESQLVKEYGFKNKKELWRFTSMLKGFYARAKKYVAKSTPQSQKEEKHLIQKLKDLNLLEGDAGLSGILGIQLKDLLERRLQTLVHKKGLAGSTKQARQFIVHGHIKVGDRKITSPSYMVTLSEEGSITFSDSSALSSPDHPERAVESKEPAKKKAES